MKNIQDLFMHTNTTDIYFVREFKSDISLTLEK